MEYEVFSVKDGITTTVPAASAVIAVQQVWLDRMVQLHGPKEYEKPQPDIGWRITACHDLHTLTSLAESRTLFEAYNKDVSVFISEGTYPRRLDIKPHPCNPQDAHKILEWMETRGGLALWHTHDLSNPGQTWTCPLRDAAGKYATKPTWSAGQIHRVIDDVHDAVVEVPKEIGRWRVAVERRGSMYLKCTTTSSRKIKRFQAAHPGSFYNFDYSVQEVVFFVADSITPIKQWVDAHPKEPTNAPVTGTGAANQAAVDH